MPNSQGQVQKEKGPGPLASQVLLSLKKAHLAWQRVTSKAVGATEERGLPLQEREQRATKLFPLTLLGCWVDPPGGVVRLSEEDPQWEGLGWLSEGQGLQSCTGSWLAAGSSRGNKDPGEAVGCCPGGAEWVKMPFVQPPNHGKLPVTHALHPLMAVLLKCDLEASPIRGWNLDS